MATQFETLHVRTAELAAVKAALASAANLRSEKAWRFRIGVGGGWTSLYPELLYDPQQFGRMLSDETGRLTLQVAGRDGLLWAIHAAKRGATLALFRSDKPTASDVTAVVEALAPALVGGDRESLANLLATKSDRYAAAYSKLCRLMGIPSPRMAFADAGDLEQVEFQLSQADPGPAPAAPPKSPLDYSAQ